MAVKRNVLLRHVKLGHSRLYEFPPFGQLHSTEGCHQAWAIQVNFPAAGQAWTVARRVRISQPAPVRCGWHASCADPDARTRIMRAHMRTRAHKVDFRCLSRVISRSGVSDGLLMHHYGDTRYIQSVPREGLDGVLDWRISCLLRARAVRTVWLRPMRCSSGCGRS